MKALIWLVGGCSVQGPQPAVHPPGTLERISARQAPERPVVPEELWVDRADGLRVADLQIGDGEEVPSSSLLVVAEITGWRPDRSRWWSTYENPEPTRFPMGSAPLRAWDLGLVGMRVGGVRVLDVPAPLAFGESGASPRIEPNTPVQMQIELLALHRPRLEPVDVPAAGRLGDFEIAEIVLGDGALVEPGRRITFDRSEWAPDGTLLATSWRDLVPPSVVLGAGLLRWEGAFEGMREGGERQVQIPAKLLPPNVVPEGSSLTLSLVLHDVQ